MASPFQSLCVFCGSNFGRRAGYREAARRLGRVMAERKIRLIYGGGAVGLMGEVADAVLKGGGEAVGVIPQALLDKEVGHNGLSELHVVGSMHERKARMASLAQGFIALPGGFGTLEELCEAITWSQLGLHGKPCGLLNTEGFFDPFQQLLDHACAEGFVSSDHRGIVIAEQEPERLLEEMAAFRPPDADKWLVESEL